MSDPLYKALPPHVVSQLEELSEWAAQARMARAIRDNLICDLLNRPAGPSKPTGKQVARYAGLNRSRVYQIKAARENRS